MSVLQAKFRNRKSRHHSSFQPTRDQVSEATKEFIKNGGTIKKINWSETDWNEYVNSVDREREADFYLRGI